ncbi:MAG: nodulation protein NfeD [Alphaproteobacteria bacterium]
MNRTKRLWARRAVALSAVAAALAILAAGGGRAQDDGGQDDGGRARDRGHAAVLTIDGPIGPAVADYIRRGLDKAVAGGATVVILQMDTPGGLDTSMRAIIKDILASPVPVIGYVGPPGARAASAGTYILYASHVAAMAPGTNLGAATPVQLGAPPPPPEEPDEDKKKPAATEDDAPAKAAGEDAEPDGEAAAESKEEPPEPAKKHPTLSDKALNDSIAYIRGLAQMRGRNVEWAVKAVEEAASLSSVDALEAGVIDLIANGIQDLLVQADGRQTEIAGKEYTLETAGLAVVEIEADWRTELLEIITNPTVAYLLLFTIGVPALLLEFYTGTMVAGVVGAICIVIGLYGLHLLPIDYAGAGLILLGIALLAGEAFMPSFGVLGIGGLISFVFGSVMLIDTDVPGLGVSPWLIGSVAAAGAGLMMVAMYALMHSRRSPVVSGVEIMLGATCPVVDWTGGTGHVRIRGETWNARGNVKLKRGARVRISEIDGLTLVVEPAEQAEQAN